jgi:hypothetical protein
VLFKGEIITKTEGEIIENFQEPLSQKAQIYMKVS